MERQRPLPASSGATRAELWLDIGRVVLALAFPALVLFIGWQIGNALGAI